MVGLESRHYFCTTGGETEASGSEVPCPDPRGSDPDLLGPFSSCLPSHGPFERPFTPMFSCEKRPPEKLLSLSAAQAPQVSSRRRRPNLGRMTVSPDVHVPRASGDRSRQKPRLPAAPGGAGEAPTARALGPRRGEPTSAVTGRILSGF